MEKALNFSSAKGIKFSIAFAKVSKLPACHHRITNEYEIGSSRRLAHL